MGEMGEPEVNARIASRGPWCLPALVGDTLRLWVWHQQINPAPGPAWPGFSH